MSSKQKLVVLLVVVVGGAVVGGLPFARAMHYRIACEKVLNRVAARQSPAAVFALPEELRKLAAGSGIDPAGVEVRVALRRVGFVEAPAYRLQAYTHHGRWNDAIVAVVDNDHVSEDYLLELGRGGVELLGMPEEAALAGQGEE